MNDRSYDTPAYRAALNAAKVERRERLAATFAHMDDMQSNLHEVYVKNEKGDLTKVDECRGTRALQVELRKSVRSRMSLGADRVLLYTNGKLRKVGIHK